MLIVLWHLHLSASLGEASIKQLQLLQPALALAEALALE